MFRPIISEDQLPKEGQEYEHSTLDFKARIDTSDRLEAAKDVAAFANASGGTLLIGAAAEGDRLKKFLPFEAEEADATKRCYEEAVRDRCRPAPIVAVSVIHREGAELVAVNVWPVAGNPVGVALKKSELRKQLEDVFFYPVRVGSHTRAILPEQMHMFVDARFRRTVISLQGSVGHRFRLHGRTPSATWRGDGKVAAVDESGNALELLLQFDSGEKRIRLPFETLEAVWRDKDAWCGRIPGYVDSIMWMRGAESRPDEEAIFIEVALAARPSRQEHRVKVTSFPRQPSPLVDAFNSIRHRFQRWRRSRSRPDQHGIGDRARGDA